MNQYLEKIAARLNRSKVGKTAKEGLDLYQVAKTKNKKKSKVEKTGRKFSRGVGRKITQQ